MKNVTTRAVVFAMVLIALIVVVQDIKRNGALENQSAQVEVLPATSEANLATIDIDQE
ncbi:hypothetical protein [Sediminibacter sp. Hel_I_10]|uniref:hypothetical protein n=1 Tax=Sediminibacter sp. Hel_I_10 TaxID=1392490 RepID=UPI0012DD32F2|nr:hypothetical protein [Sediminibacter sp. Hel_I_10]